MAILGILSENYFLSAWVDKRVFERTGFFPCLLDICNSVLKVSSIYSRFPSISALRTCSMRTVMKNLCVLHQTLCYMCWTFSSDAIDWDTFAFLMHVRVPNAEQALPSWTFWWSLRLSAWSAWWRCLGRYRSTLHGLCFLFSLGSGVNTSNSLVIRGSDLS